MTGFFVPDIVSILFGGSILALVLYAMWATKVRVCRQQQRLEIELEKERQRRRRMVTAYRMNRTYFDSAFDEIPVPIFFKNAEGRYTKVNNAFAAMLGQRKADIVGTGVKDVAPSDLAKKYYDMDKRLFYGEELRQSYESQILFQDGIKHDVVFHKAALRTRTGVVTGIFGMVFDVSSLKTTERNLREALSESHAVFDNSLVGVVLLKGGRFIEKINMRGAEIFGYTPDELYGQSVSVLHVSPKHFLEFGKKYVSRLEHEALLHIEYPMLRRDNATIWCALSGKAVVASDLAQGVIWIVDDITERKRFDSMREEMGRLVRRDLDDPLGTLFSVTETFVAENTLNQDQLDRVFMMENTALRMLDLVSISLVILGNEQRFLDIERERVDMLWLARHVVASLERTAQRQHVHLVLHDAPPPMILDKKVFLYGEKSLLYSMLSSMIKNVLDTAQPGQTISVSVFQTNATILELRSEQSASEALRDVFEHADAWLGMHDDIDFSLYSMRLIAEAHGGVMDLIHDDEHKMLLRVRFPHQSALCDTKDETVSEQGGVNV